MTRWRRGRRRGQFRGRFTPDWLLPPPLWTTETLDLFIVILILLIILTGSFIPIMTDDWFAASPSLEERDLGLGRGTPTPQFQPLFSSLDYIRRNIFHFPSFALLITSQNSLLLLVIRFFGHVWSACAGQFTMASLRSRQPHNVQIRTTHTGEIVQQKTLTVSVNGTTWSGTNMVLLLYFCVPLSNKRLWPYQ